MEHPRFPSKADSRKKTSTHLASLSYRIFGEKIGPGLTNYISRLAKDICSATGVQLIKVADLPKKGMHAEHRMEVSGIDSTSLLPADHVVQYDISISQGMVDRGFAWWRPNEDTGS